MEHYCTIKWNTFESVVVRQMNLEPIIIIQSEISQIEKNKYMIKKQISYINAYTWNLEKWY